MDEASRCIVPYGIYADNAPISRSVDIPDSYAYGAWNYVGGKRSASNRTAIRHGYLNEIQCHEHGSRNDYRNQPHENRGEEITEVKTKK